MLKILEKVEIYFTWIENRIITITSLLLAIVSIIAVFNRYFFKYSMSWYEEISMYLFMLLVYWGSSKAARDKTHFSISIITDKFKSRNRSYLMIFICLACLLISLLGVYFGIKMSLITTQKTASLRLPSSIIMFSTIVMCFIGMSLRYLCEIINKIKKLKEDYKNRIGGK